VRHALVISLALLAVAGCAGDDGGGGGGPVSQDEGEELVLAFADIGRPFVQFDQGELVKTDFVPPRENPDRFDREGGWKARYHRPGTAETKGPIVIESRADLFGSTDGADKDFDLYKDVLAELREGAGGRTVPVANLGEEAGAVTFGQGFPPRDIRHVVIAWRQGTVTAMVAVNGFARGMKIAEAVALARKQERRIDAAESG
jgi:hypothetical protein